MRSIERKTLEIIEDLLTGHRSGGNLEEIASEIARFGSTGSLLDSSAGVPGFRAHPARMGFHVANSLFGPKEERRKEEKKEK